MLLSRTYSPISSRLSTGVRFSPVQAIFRWREMSSSTGAVVHEDPVLFEETGNAGITTLNRPKVLNSLNLEMVLEMKSKFDTWERDPNVKVIVLKGAGGKAFCAGGDVVHIAKAGMAGDTSVAHKFFSSEYVLNHAIGTLKTPYVALIDGITMGGGVGVSVHGRFRVATETTLFAMPETAIGLIPDVGGGYFLPRLKNHLGMYLALTGARLRGVDVYHAGIATHFVPKEKLSTLTSELTFVTSSQGVEEILEKFHEEPLDEFSLKPHLSVIEEAFSKNTAEEMITCLESRGEWGIKQANTIRRMSPSSVKVTVRQLREGKTKTLAEDLKMELRCTAEAMRQKDFYEGIRALLIDKSNDPKWSPSWFYPTNCNGILISSCEWWTERSRKSCCYVEPSPT
eukprot:CFRG4968T1